MVTSTFTRLHLTMIPKKKEKFGKKSKYLGKNIDGVPVKVRSQESVPKKALSYGEFIPLMNITNEMKLA